MLRNLVTLYIYIYIYQRLSAKRIISSIKNNLSEMAGFLRCQKEGV